MSTEPKILNPKIAVPSHASLVERFAAEELSKYLERATGVQAPLVPDETESADDDILFCIGSPWSNKAAARHWGPRSFPELEREAFTIRSAGQAVILAGAVPRATLYSVYAFLERCAGARWFYFDPAEQIVPFQGKEMLHRIFQERISIEEAPAFHWREIRLQTFFPADVLLWAVDWMGKNRINVAAVAMDLVPDWEQESAFRTTLEALHPELEKRDILVHFYSYWWYKQAPTAEQIREHPEWQALVDGVRIPPQHETHPPVCLSQPAAVRIFEQNVVRLLGDIHSRYPQTRIFFFMTRYFHNTNWCQCPGCKRDLPLALESDVVNRVARRLRSLHPEALLVWNIGVQDRNIIPLHIDLEPNVVLFHERYLDADYTLPFTDPSNDSWWDESLKQLQQLKRKLGVPYAFHCEFANLPGFGPQILPLPYTAFELQYVLSHDVDYLIHHNEGFSDGWWVGGLPLYATAKAQWDPAMNLDFLLGEYFAAYFGNAAEDMREFFYCWDRAFPNKLFKSQSRNFNDPVASGGHGSKAQIASPARPDEDPSFYQEATTYNQHVLQGLSKCEEILQRARTTSNDVIERLGRMRIVLDYVRRERELTGLLLDVQLHRLGVQPCVDSSGLIRKALKVFRENIAFAREHRGKGLFWNSEFWTDEQFRDFVDSWSAVIDA